MASNRLYSKNDANFVRIQKTISRLIQYWNDPNGNVINLSKNSFLHTDSIIYLMKI